MMPTKEQIDGLLATNQYWANTEKLAISPSSIPIHKIVTFNKIYKDLYTLYEDDEFGTEVFQILARQIATTDWTFKCGTFPIWNSMLSKAKGVVKKKLTGKSDLDSFSKGLLKHGTKETIRWAE